MGGFFTSSQSHNFETKRPYAARVTRSVARACVHGEVPPGQLICAVFLPNLLTGDWESLRAWLSVGRFSPT